MTTRYPYTIILPGTTWTPTGPTPDRILGRYRHLDDARRAFREMLGPRVLREDAGPSADEPGRRLYIDLDRAMV